MASKLNNCFLINAPAGSGKTTQIKAMVQKYIVEMPGDNILCITYTNRAAEELSNGIESKNVYIGTIHSFLHAFMKRYFTHQDILDLYYEVYGDQIKGRIENLEQTDYVADSNSKYVEKYGELSYEAIRKNIKTLSYNESPFNSLYYGGLSHDDLISFSKHIFDRYSIIGKMISSKYQHIFIDEYQDTMADVLKIFYKSVAGSNTHLYLFGDRMQQIYRNYDGSFEEQFELFDTTQSLLINHRSVTAIVKLLNKICNDPSFDQDNSRKMKSVSADFLPRIVISDNIDESINGIKESDSSALVLYLLNRERFGYIGALNLYQAFSGMDKYSFGKTYTAVDVLTTPYDVNPDPLIKVLYCIVHMADCYQKEQYGSIIQTLKTYKSMFCKDSWYIKTHDDKKKLLSKLKKVFAGFKDENKTIADLLTMLLDTSIAENTYVEGIYADRDYHQVFDVPVIELKRVIEYLGNPKVSTQHGVKGESHDSVVFVADNCSTNPVVHMYRFFDMWGNFSVSLKPFSQFYYSYITELADLQYTIGIKISDLKKDTYTQHEKAISEKIATIIDKFTNNSYFMYLCMEKYDQYLKKPGVTKAKDCLKESTVFGVLSAYKLFYVGCSRARKNLTILLDRSKVIGDFERQKRRFIEIGFTILQADSTFNSISEGGQ